MADPRSAPAHFSGKKRLGFSAEARARDNRADAPGINLDLRYKYSRLTILKGNRESHGQSIGLISDNDNFVCKQTSARRDVSTNFK